MKLFTFILLFFSALISLQSQTTLTGKVIDTNGDGLVGANVVINATSTGTITDFDGSFSLTTDQAPPFTLVVSYTGYTDQELEIRGSQNDMTITLAAGVLLDDLIVSASRKREKIQEAPASVSVLGARQLSVSPDIDPTRSLGAMPGVTIQQQSAGKINIEMRAANAVFFTSVFPILDYRNLVGAGIGSFNSANNGISTIDLDRIEVVRGPGSALYGAGVTAGVVHYITKSPINHPGTTVELMGGQLNTFVTNVRHATKVSDKFGFKFNVNYRRGDEFTLDPEDPTDAATIAQFQNTLTEPAILNGRADPLGVGTVIVDNLDTDGDGNPMASDYYSFSANTTLEFRPSEDLSINLSGGVNDSRSLFWTNQGEGLAPGFEYWTQARAQYKGLFAQVFYSDNNAGFGADLPPVGYRTGLAVGVARRGFESQVQYNFELPSANLDITTGFDTRQAFSDSRRYTYGRYEEDDDYSIIGAYIQGKWAATPKIDVLAAGRYDSFNFLDDGFFSPRLAVVFKPTPKHTFRASYNKAAGVPNALDMFLDLPGPGIVPGLLNIWIGGLNTQHTFGQNASIDVTIPGVPNLPIGTPGMPLAVPYFAVNQGVIDAITPILGPDPLGIIPFLQEFVPAGITGQLYGWNIFEGPESPLAIQDNPAVSPIVNTTYEIGYSGFIKDKLKLTLDIYNNTIGGARNLTALAPTYSLLGADSGAGLSAAVGAALTSHLEGLNVPAEQIPMIVGGIAGGYQAAGQAFDDPVTGAGALYPVFGAAESDSGVVPLDDGLAYIAGGFRIVEEDINYTGIDFGSQYYITDDLIGYFNYSWLSQTEWTPGEDDVSAPYNLNTAQNRYRVGLQYVPTLGFSGSLAFQHTPSFNTTFGLFTGRTDSQDLVDLNIGYGFENGLKVGFSVTNLFDSEYRYAPSMPKIGRQALASLRYTFGPKE